MTDVSMEELLVFARHRRWKSGDVRDCAIEFIGQFRVAVRDDVVDAIVAVRQMRDAHLPVDPETEVLADSAGPKEAFLAALIIEADMRDAVKGMVARLNAEDEVSGRPPFSWLGHGSQ